LRAAMMDDGLSVVGGWHPDADMSDGQTELQ
jgi:hypothetical protein